MLLNASIRLNGKVFWKFLEVCDVIEPLFMLNCEVLWKALEAYDIRESSFGKYHC